MRSHPLLFSLLACLLAAPAWAQTASPAASAPTAPASASAPSLPPRLAPAEAQAPASRVPEPQLLHEINEDDHVRIDELRQRGQTQRIIVQPKIPGMPAYQIVPLQAGRSAAQDARAGQRVWLDLTF